MNTLKEILKLYKIPHKDIAEALNITEGTASLKINGKADFTVAQAKVIKELIKNRTEKDIPIEFLFN